ncbi:Telomere repeats-binding bouquet formation protein 1 [Collichthys lucidus]|uniref:Telomere repeats-binding bouquet formation protein 1 n=1 Tax=Collichthys lucidus TaxID=240159 RepID=A0A4U5UH03_COLLU|nr:Telomere repeats-binding bouquet formation protein 1 [Collichthys lucidus]
MDKAAVCSTSRNTIRTDLTLLLECLKFQMKCPDLQKQALLAIHSICEKREDTVDILREIGGETFIYNLAKSNIVCSDVKETALFTLGTLAESNVYCKNSLCRKETFVEIAKWLMKEDIPLTLKRVSVYLLSVLVSNNKSGQTLAQTTGCLDILLDLFRATFPLSTDATLRPTNATQTNQLWASVSSALCGCVNNPQNDEGQSICVAVFPIIKVWLEQITMPRTEIFQPICSFIAMTVANNASVQESFSASGCLNTLALALVRLAPASDTSLLSCQLSVIITKTLSACITDNSTLASGLSQYDMVTHLFNLLASPHLDPEDRLSVLLTLGHCTEASEEHQSQLVQCGGLPVIITLLTEDTSEEVRKAATFILQTCKEAREDGNVEPLTNLEAFRSSARELLHRIDLLAKRQAKENEDEQEDAEPSASTLPPVLPLLLQKEENIKTIPTAYKQISTHMHVQAGGDNSIKSQTVKNVMNENELKNVSSDLRLQGCEMSKAGKIPAKKHSFAHIRCAGCVMRFEEVTSRTFASVQSSCRHSCDIHKVLQEATERYRTRNCRLLFRRQHQDVTADSKRVSAAEPQRKWKNCSEVRLTPMCKGAEKRRSSKKLNVIFNSIDLIPRPPRSALDSSEKANLLKVNM